MAGKLYYNTVAPLLLDTLMILMESDRFDAFRLVGGTALSLQRGHRKSMDIDLFTDAVYDSIDFEPICLKGKHWEIIKLDIIDFAKKNMIGS